MDEHTRTARAVSSAAGSRRRPGRVDGAEYLLVPAGRLFGRRDRCVLVLSQLDRIPHRQLSRLMTGDVSVALSRWQIGSAPRKRWTIRGVGRARSPAGGGPTT